MPSIAFYVTYAIYDGLVCNRSSFGQGVSKKVSDRLRGDFMFGARHKTRISALRFLLLVLLAADATIAANLQMTFRLAGEPSELSSTANGGIVTPTIGPQGILTINGSGAVGFTPAQTGNGVYFSSCCGSTNNAAYKFTGAQLGNFFYPSQAGEINFYLKSLKTWAQRQTQPSYNYRMVFDVDSDPVKMAELFYFYVSSSSGNLILAFNNGATSGFYYVVPTGQEDTLFGNGVILFVRIAWDGSHVSLYLNNNLAAGPYSYTPATPTWGANSVFMVGAENYMTSDYDSSDDIAIDEFHILSPGAPDVQAPTVPTGLTASPISTSQINLSWTASTDNVAVAGYQIFRDTAQVGTSAGTTYFDTGLAPNTSHTYTVTAFDAAGNISAQSSSVTATTFNVDTTPPSVAITSPLNGATISGVVTVTANATDNVSVASVQFKLDGANLGQQSTSQPYSASWDTTASSNGPHTLTATATDSSGNSATSASQTVTVANVPPQISSVAAGKLSFSSAVITWTTSRPADSQVNYGASPS